MTSAAIRTQNSTDQTRAWFRSSSAERKIAPDAAIMKGVSAEVIASTDHHSFREKMLFTHRGLSGPAILQISSYWNQDAT